MQGSSGLRVHLCLCWLVPAHFWMVSAAFAMAESRTVTCSLWVVLGVPGISNEPGEPPRSGMTNNGVSGMAVETYGTACACANC